MRLQSGSILVASLALSSTTRSAPTGQQDSSADHSLSSDSSEPDLQNRQLDTLGDTLAGILDGLPVLGPIVKGTGVDGILESTLDGVGTLVDGIIKKRSEGDQDLTPIAMVGDAMSAVPALPVAPSNVTDAINSTTSGLPLPAPIAGVVGTATGVSGSAASTAAGTVINGTGALPINPVSTAGGVPGNAVGGAGNVTGALPLPVNPLSVAGGAAGTIAGAVPVTLPIPQAAAGQEIDVILIPMPGPLANATSALPIGPSNVTSHANGTGPGNATSTANNTITGLPLPFFPGSPALPANPPNSPVAGVMDTRPGILEILEVPPGALPLPTPATPVNGSKSHPKAQAPAPPVQPPVASPAAPVSAPGAGGNASASGNSTGMPNNSTSSSTNSTAPTNSTDSTNGTSTTGISDDAANTRRRRLNFRFNRRGLF